MTEETQDAEIYSLEWKPSIENAIVPAGPNALVQMAIDKDFDLDRLQQLIDMRDREEAKKAEREYIAAMNRCQQKMPIVVRDAENQQTRSKYARLENVASAMRPVYTSEGFTLEFSEGVSELPNHRRIVCEVSHDGGHKKNVHLDSPIDDVGAQGKANKTAIQGLGSLVSYLRRYLTLMIFNVVVADEDNDGNNQDDTISEEEVCFIETHIEKCKAAGSPVDLKIFKVNHCKIGIDDDYSLMRKSRYPAIKEGLRMKLEAAKR